MKIVYIHSAYKPNDLYGSWFEATRTYCKRLGGDAWFGIKFNHREKQDHDIIIGDSISCGIHNRVFEYTGLQDMFSIQATKKFLSELDIIKPDIIHCHIINDFILNLGLFCDYVNSHNIKVVWTFHDARVLTGQCPDPDYSQCDEWKSICRKCPKDFRMLNPSKEWFNLVAYVHGYRKKTIGNLHNLTIVTPSKWMSSLVAQSYLKSKQCKVINNGIDLSVFKPIKSNIRQQYEIPQDCILLLSVGNPLSQWKGREYLLKLAKELPENYYLVLIGVLENDMNIFQECDRVTALPRLDRSSLIDFYSAADLFVNPTLADNFPTVNLEAQACGCPVVAFDSDGTPETVAPRGKVVPRKNYVAWKNAILNFSYVGAREDAIRFATQFSREKCIQQYIELYNSVLQ